MPTNEKSEKKKTVTEKLMDASDIIESIMLLLVFAPITYYIYLLSFYVK